MKNFTLTCNNGDCDSTDVDIFVSEGEAICIICNDCGNVEEDV